MIERFVALLLGYYANLNKNFKFYYTINSI